MVGGKNNVSAVYIGSSGVAGSGSFLDKGGIKSFSVFVLKNEKLAIFSPYAADNRVFSEELTAYNGVGKINFIRVTPDNFITRAGFFVYRELISVKRLYGY